MGPIQKLSARMRVCLGLAGLLAGLGVSSTALAQGTVTQSDDDKPPGPQPSLGLAPGTPQVGTLPGGLTPAYGQAPADQGDWRFDFHGFMTMPLRAGINTRSGVVTTDLRLNEPRYIKLPDIMKAKKKPLDVTSMAELGVAAPAHGIRTLKYDSPAVRSRGVMVKDAAELVAALQQRGIL